MLKYHEENPSLVQLAQTQAHLVLPSYTRMSTCFQVKDHPIYPGLNNPDQGGVKDEFVKYILSPLLLEKTDILVYWQVSLILYLIESMLKWLVLPIGPQVRIPYTLCYCHGLPSDSSVFCPLQTCLLIGCRNQHQEMKLNDPCLNGGFTNAEVLAEEAASKLHVWLEDLRICNAGRDRGRGGLSGGDHAWFFVGWGHQKGKGWVAQLWHEELWQLTCFLILDCTIHPHIIIQLLHSLFWFGLQGYWSSNSKISFCAMFQFLFNPLLIPFLCPCWIQTNTLRHIQVSRSSA